VAHYNLLMLDHVNEVVSSGVCDAETDEDAMAAARVWLCKHSAVEVWKGPNLVAIVNSPSTALTP